MNRTIQWQKWDPPTAELTDDFESDPVRRIRITTDESSPSLDRSALFGEFNDWLGHANFDLGVRSCELVASLPGVEGFEIFSRYRFRICIGKAFDDSLVRLEVQRVLNALPRPAASPKDVLDPATREKVETIEEVYGGRYRFWAIYVVPNLEIETFHSDYYPDLHQQIHLYRQARDLVGGVLITSHDLA